MHSASDTNAAHTLSAGDLQATFLPARGMLGASLRHRGEELLRRIEDLEAAARGGSTAGLPLLHPWANRLAGPRYAVAGREVILDLDSPLLHSDAGGLPIHGVPWSRLAFETSHATSDRLVANLDWTSDDLLAVFPFPHRLEVAATLEPNGLTVATTLVAGSERAVPVSFGFHPYLGLPGLAREHWHIELPAMRRLILDARMIPTGDEEPFAARSEKIGQLQLDDGFALSDATATMAIQGAGRRVAVELLEGYAFAQVYVPPGKDFVALEPMTAPSNALGSGRGLHVVAPGRSYRAVFRIRVETIDRR